MMVKASNTAITNATALEPGRFEPKEETIVIKRIKWKFPKKSLNSFPPPVSCEMSDFIGYKNSLFGFHVWL